MTKRADFPRDLSPLLYEEASDWFLQLNAATKDTHSKIQKGVEIWLAKDPAHAKAYRQVESAWAAIGENATAPEMVIARRNALKRAGLAARNRWGSGSNLRHFAAAAAVLIIIVSVTLFTVFTGKVSETVLAYETAVGEIRVLTLADNSRISLDASTHLEVQYSPEARTIELYSGQAYFNVAKDPLRPFRVKVGGQTVEALGTEFNVEMIEDQVLITLIEGRVSVSSELPSNPAESETQMLPEPVELFPGQQLVIRAERIPEIIQETNLAKTTAWRQGKLIFEDEPLSTAVMRMNRYSHIKIIVEDEKIKSLGVSGVFNAGDIDAFVEALETYFGLESVSGGDQSIHLRSPG